MTKWGADNRMDCDTGLKNVFVNQNFCFQTLALLITERYCATDRLGSVNQWLNRVKDTFVESNYAQLTPTEACQSKLF